MPFSVDVMRSKGKHRAYRLAVGILAPPVIGSVLFTLSIIGIEWNNGRLDLDGALEWISTIHVIVAFSLLLVGIQSIVYSVVMEFVVRPKY